jgi:hypothetical protein
MKCHLITENPLDDDDDDDDDHHHHHHHHNHHHRAVLPESFTRGYTASLCPWVSVVTESVINMHGDAGASEERARCFWYITFLTGMPHRFLWSACK